MADPTGFLKTPRQDCARRPVRERVRDWNEVYDRPSPLPNAVHTPQAHTREGGVCLQALRTGERVEVTDLATDDRCGAADYRVHAPGRRRAQLRFPAVARTTAGLALTIVSHRNCPPTYRVSARRTRNGFLVTGDRHPHRAAVPA